MNILRPAQVTKVQGGMRCKFDSSQNGKNSVHMDKLTKLKHLYAGMKNGNETCSGMISVHLTHVNSQLH